MKPKTQSKRSKGKRNPVPGSMSPTDEYGRTVNRDTAGEATKDPPRKMWKTSAGDQCIDGKPKAQSHRFCGSVETSRRMTKRLPTLGTEVEGLPAEHRATNDPSNNSLYSSSAITVCDKTNMLLSGRDLQQIKM